MTWVKLHDIDRSWSTSVDLGRALDNISALVYYVSLLRLDHALHELISSEQLESADTGSIACNNVQDLQRINAHDVYTYLKTVSLCLCRYRFIT